MWLGNEHFYVKNIVIFTGLPRMPDLFKQSIGEMTDLIDEGILDDIYFVTWDGRLSDKKALRSYLESHSVQIIQPEESPVAGDSNIWHQMKALEIGLDVIPDDAYVLKTRTDVHIEKEFLRKLFAREIDELATTAGSDVFEQRIWVSYFIVSEPFYVNDQCFAGLARDLEKLYNYSEKLPVYDYSLNSHVRRFIHPYLEEFDVLHDLLQYNSLDEIVADEYGLYQKRIRSSVFGMFYAFYYKTMLEDFYVEHSPVEFHFQFPEGEGPPRPAIQRPLSHLNDETFLGNFTKEYSRKRDDEWLTKDTKLATCYRTDWLQAHFTEPVSDDVPDTVCDGINRSFDEWHTVEIDEADLQADIRSEQEFVKEYPKPGPVLWIGNTILKPLGLYDVGQTAYNRLVRWWVDD